MASAQPHYLLKLLSGPHRGAEVRLVAGSYRIGRHDDADIVLDDTALADEHALVTIEAEGLRVEPLLGEVVVEGAPHREPGRRLPFFTVLGFGTTHLALGPEGAAWPSLAAPEQPAPGRMAAPLAASPPAAPPPPPARAGWSRAWLAAPVLLLALAALARPLERVEAPAVAPAPPPDPVASLEAHLPAVRAALAGVEVTGLRLEPDLRRGRLLVEGWVPSEAERKALMERLDGLGAPLALRLWSKEQVMAGVATTLQALGRPLESAWAGPGAVTLKGYIPDASDLQRAVDLLQRDVSGLARVDNQVLTDEAVEVWLQDRLDDAGLAQVLRVKRGERALQVRGLLSAEQRAAFTAVAEAYAEGPGRYLGLEAQLGDAKGPLPAVLPERARLTVRAVSPGPPAYIVLEDGEKYLEGSRLPGGWTLERIEGGGLVVARDGRREAVSF